ncbi:hypothetical protein GDO81_017619 [Engystomops pustulosus]|uniref:Nucleoside-diphosphate kinase n=1 Tax=Engystomops pustulosus TaxID=76066 RepID=A0AAV7A625_ENGPU|nr:hypothetical protein GDO81_017619 [Engystomops pustulosus]
MKPLVVFCSEVRGVRGPQCERIVEKYGYTHLSAGDLLRDERKRPGSQYGELIESYITDGSTVDSSIRVIYTSRAMEQTMAQHRENKFLIDGFPRNEDNRRAGPDHGRSARVLVLFFDCDNETCIARCLERGEEQWKK